MQYKGYLARVRFDDIADIWEGEVIGLAHVKFQAKAIDDVEAAFQVAVDHYLGRKEEAEELLKNLQREKRHDFTS